MNRNICVIFLLCFLLVSGCIDEGDPRAFTQNLTEPLVEGDPMIFGTTIDAVGYRIPDSYLGSINYDDAKKEIDVAKDLGMDFVRFDIRNETLAYPDEINKLDMTIDYARNKDLKIYIGVYGMETWLSSILSMIVTSKKGGAGKADWDEFKEMYMWEANYLANRYNPDYMMIIVECPYNIGNQVNSQRSTKEWVEYTKQVAHMINETSPDTEIILGETARTKSSPTSIEYIEEIMKDNDRNIDIIGIHPYSFEELDDEILSVTWLKSKYNWPGDIWIDETNTFTFKDEEHQKEYFKYALSVATQNEIKGFVVFRLRDISDDISGNYGIVGKNFEKKPAYYVIKESINKSHQQT